MEIPEVNTRSVWAEPDEVQGKSDLARDVENILWTILRRTGQFEPLDPVKDEWDDPLALDLPETKRIRQYIKEMKLSLRHLALVGDALESSAAKHRTGYIDHLFTESDDRRAYIEARPFSECLRCWTEGYSTNRQKSWQDYLVEAAKPLQKTWKRAKEPQEKKFHILRYEFVKLYDENASDRNLFRDRDGNVIPKPKGGPRPNGPVHEENEVDLWVCDSRDPYGHRDEFSKRPNEGFIQGGDSSTDDVVKAGQYRPKATIFDRYFCPGYESCGGVLIPRFRNRERERQKQGGNSKPAETSSPAPDGRKQL